MPLDGVVIKNLVIELNSALSGGRIDKIFQPEPDEIIVSVRKESQNYKLLLSANASYPRIHITDAAKQNPLVAPNFCMYLRKHIAGGIINGFSFHDFERMISISVDSANELGEISTKTLIIEIMGKYSNIILVSDKGMILDAIRHVDSEMSSLREVMPARAYSPPPPQDKMSPQGLDFQKFVDEIEGDEQLGKYMQTRIKGVSNFISSEICIRAGIKPDIAVSLLSESQKKMLFTVLSEVFGRINDDKFKPYIILDKNGSPLDFYCIETVQAQNVKYIDSINQTIDEFYRTKDLLERLKQKKADITKILANNIKRCAKKIKIHNEKLDELSTMENLRLFGELIMANIYCIPEGSEKTSVQNYYAEGNPQVEISLDENLSVSQNAQRYFGKYKKAKTGSASATKQLEEAKEELIYLESVAAHLIDAIELNEIDEIRQELTEQGYIAKKKIIKKSSVVSEPEKLKSADGFVILVGKNNKQNDILTLKTAASNDIWLHTKNIPGAHVIIKVEHNKEVPMSTLVEAASIAAHHSKARESSNVPVDYTEVKHVKKPAGARPGMVIYKKFRTLTVNPSSDKV